MSTQTYISLNMAVIYVKWRLFSEHLMGKNSLLNLQNCTYHSLKFKYINIHKYAIINKSAWEILTCNCCFHTQGGTTCHTNLYYLSTGMCCYTVLHFAFFLYVTALHYYFNTDKNILLPNTLGSLYRKYNTVCCLD